ncbi:hypothetical protein E2C01_034236 [Portunus trituberculatus]|uniref:Uncharacterized protein n=1 Tax=Portunus trituberculatus TaxID=210409 RepID=A0A5B7F2B5_PORTR|nr:hypothetical protein [Portunus trituberculatus]
MNEQHMTKATELRGKTVHSPARQPDATTHGQAGFSGFIKTSCQRRESLRPMIMKLKTATNRKEAFHLLSSLYRYKKDCSEIKPIIKKGGGGGVPLTQFY